MDVPSTLFRLMCRGVDISMNARVGRSPLDSRLRGNDERDRNDGRDGSVAFGLLGVGSKETEEDN